MERTAWVGFPSKRLVQPEHDGIVSTRYHRGAFIERFDVATIRQHHELDGLSTALPLPAYANPTPRIHQLDEHVIAAQLQRRGPSPNGVPALVNDEYAGPRRTPPSGPHRT